MPIEISPGTDHKRLLEGVTTFNLHPHLPQLEVAAAGAEKIQILAR
jgi:hypothetical protein